MVRKGVFSPYRMGWGFFRIFFKSTCDILYVFALSDTFRHLSLTNWMAHLTDFVTTRATGQVPGQVAGHFPRPNTPPLRPTAPCSYNFGQTPSPIVLFNLICIRSHIGHTIAIFVLKTADNRKGFFDRIGA